MSDYSSVAPPQSQQSQAFAAALQRAKQIAAKIHPNSQQQGGVGIKRSLDDDSGPDAKKFSSPESTHSQTSITQAMAQAAAVAARLSATGGNTIEEQIRYPDNIVGLMVGRGSNDNISHLQMETGCKIQLSNESDRVVILRGSRDSVSKARDMIQQMTNQNGGGAVDVLTTVTIPPPGANGYPPYQEVMIPGPKVGLVIGKGGETIKMLQEKTGAKMVIIQDGPGQELIEKPLRISGDPQKIEHAKSLVFDLIQDKEIFRPGFNSGGEQAEVFVPKTAVGVVIGKGGDMIKKIQNETGCKLQFIQGKNDGPGDRRCIIQGTRQQVDDGKRMIEELIDSVMRSNQGANRNMNPQDNGNSAYGYGYGVNHSQQPQREEVTFAVPASKCGIVIGRGGETIKLINQQSGAYCEMDRSAVNPPSEKMFKAKGTPEQIEHARQMISEKINVDIVILSRKPIGNAPAHGNYNNNMQNENSNTAYPQQWGYPQGWDQSQQQPTSVQINPSTGQPDYSQQWIEYYKSMGLHREAEMIEQQLKAKQAAGAAAAQPMPGTTSNGTGVVQTPTMAGAQAAAAPVQQAPVQDYSAQWAEYYRSIGKIDEAEAIEKQIAVSKAATGATTTAASNPSQNPAVTAGAPQQPAGYPQGMPAAAGYAQYSQYYAAAAAGQAGYPQAYGAYGAYPGAPQAPQPPQPNQGPPGHQQQQQQQQNQQNDKN